MGLDEIRRLKAAAEEKEASKKQRSDGLVEYYRGHMATAAAVCANCGKAAAWLKNPKYHTLWHACQAHVLPKSKFPSVAAHPDNHLVLFPSFFGLCGCHDTYDSSWAAAKKMPVWERALEIIKKLEPLLAKIERERLEKVN